MIDDFNIRKNEFVISLYDGLDLSRSAAEYIMAWESLEKSPSDLFSLNLKDTAETIIKFDKKEGVGYLLASMPTFGEPTNHVWANGMVRREGRGHSIFPTYRADVKSSYTDAHFPYHEMNHPLRQINHATGLPNMFEVLRSLALGGASTQEMEMEKKWYKTMTEKNSPLVTGIKVGSKTIPILGDINAPGTVAQHQHHLYERDYRRWKKQNADLETELQSRGLKGKELESELRHSHFDDKVKEWTSKEGELGLDGFMYGLEWFTPEERDSIEEQLHEGIDKKSTLTLPNGEKIPTARIAVNNLLRRTPEMNFMLRSNQNFGRNAHYRNQSNEEDYSQGENRFIRSALGEYVHNQNDMLDYPIADYILSEINEKYAVDDKAPLQVLPSLEIHKTKPKDKYNYQDLQRASKHKRLSMEDLLFLAGFDPNTKQLIDDHPIHGKMDGPIIDLPMLEKVQDHARRNGTTQQLAKEMVNDLAFLKSPHGPHPDEEKQKFWENHPDGYTYGPGKFYSSLYDNIPGMNVSPSTWIEFLHSMSHDKDNSIMFQTDPNNYQFWMPNQDNTILGMHFGPLFAPPIGAFDTTKYKFDYTPEKMPLQNIFSPFGTGKSSNRTEKNNYTEHKSAINPMYEYAIRTANPAFKQQLGTHNQHLEPHTSTNPTIMPKSTSMYGTHPSDSRLHERAVKAQLHNTFLNRVGHPFTPPKKAIAQLKDFLTGDLTLSAGLDLQEFKDYVGWDSKPTTYSNVKDTIETGDYPIVRLVNSVSKILNTTDSRKINNFIQNLSVDKNDENYKILHDYYMDNHDFAVNDKVNLDEARSKLQSVTSKLHQRKLDGPKKKYQPKTTSTDAIQSILRFGGDIVSTEKENRIRETIDSINEMMMNPDLSQEQVMGLREDLQDAVTQLNQVQLSTKQKDKPTSHWKINAKQYLDMLRSHHDTVVDYAKNVVMPLVLEQQPDAFDPNNPVQFIHNVQKLLADTQRHILATDNHDLSPVTYGIDYNVVSQKPKEINEHGAIANHLLESGAEIDGNMSVDEVINMLNLEKTPAMKEHVANIINESSLREQPLFVSTVGNMLTSGTLSKIGNADISHLHTPNDDIMGTEYDDLNSNDKFHHDLHNSNIHNAITIAQKRARKENENWKANPIHGLSQSLNHILNTKHFGQSMQNSGLEFFHARDFDAHGAKDMGKGVKKVTATTRNNLDSLIVLDERKLMDERGGVLESAFEAPTTETVARAGLGTHSKIGRVNPTNASIYNIFGVGDIHEGFVAEPSFGIETNIEGEPIVGEHAQPGFYPRVSEEALNTLFGKETVQQVLPNLPPPQTTLSAHQGVNMDTYLSPSDDPSTIAMSEVSTYITSLLNPDILLMKNDDVKWSPPIRPMHRIFEISDLHHLRGFSGSWVVSKWYDGKRVIIVNEDETITTYDEDGKKVGLKKVFKENLSKLNKRDYVIDGILGEDELNIIDILNYDANNVSDMTMFERMKLLRSQFDSHENIIIPGPHDTKMTDEEGLDETVSNLQKEHEVLLLRDGKSTYMKGERRHPKWMLLRNTKDYNFIVLDVKGKNSHTYRLGAGPILDGSKLGNRAVEVNGQEYMDIGTIHNQTDSYKVGDVVRVSITGVTKKTRGGRDVFNVQMKQITGKGDGEGAASAESLDILTKSLTPILVPHDIEYDNNKLKVILKDVDTVEYDVVSYGNLWYLENPSTVLSGMVKSNYPVTLAESMYPYWSAVAPLMFDGHLVKRDVLDEKPPSRKRQDKQSAGILDADDDNRLLKPTTKKALEIITRALDKLHKERTTWTGPKGLGIDMATPIESPSGPTRLANEETMPDYDGRKRSDEKEIEPKKNKKEKKPIKHIEVNDNTSQLSDFNKID